MSEKYRRYSDLDAFGRVKDFAEHGRSEPQDRADLLLVISELTQLRQRVAELDKPHDTVWPGEEDAERIWKVTGGVGPDDGRMWLTPRMARVAAKAAAAMAQQKEGVK